MAKKDFAETYWEFVTRTTRDVSTNWPSWKLGDSDLADKRREQEAQAPARRNDTPHVAKPRRKVAG